MERAISRASRQKEFRMEIAISRFGRPWPAFVPRANKSFVWKGPFPGWGGPGPLVRLANKKLVWKWGFPGCGGPGPLSCLALIRVSYGNGHVPAGAALARFRAWR